MYRASTALTGSPVASLSETARPHAGRASPAGIDSNEAGISIKSKLNPAPVAVETPASSADETCAELERLCAELTGRVAAAAKARTAGLKRLTVLRRANEDLQNCFAALERQLPAADRLDLVFSSETDAADRWIALRGGSQGFAQVLPVPSDGLSAVELLVREVTPAPGAVLRLHLVSLADHQLLDRWTVPLERIGKGWTLFGLDRVLTGGARALELHVALDGEGAELVLGCGDAQPIRHFRLRESLGQGEAHSGSLALRVFAGAPEAAFASRLVVVADERRLGTETANSYAPQFWVPVSPTLIARVSHANPQEVQFDFPAARPFPAEAGLECHPPAEGMTLAEIPLPALGARIRGASALARVAHPKSKPIRFALVLAADAARAGALLRGEAKPDVGEGFSGWHTASARDEAPTSLAAAASEPASRPSKLFAATRMDRPGFNDFAWARVRDVQIKVGS